MFSSSSANYSIKHTSEAWGIIFDQPLLQSSLKKIFEHIKTVSNSAVEATTPAISNDTLIRVHGDLIQPAANGHLVLNPAGIDLRMIPGKIKSVTYEKKAENKYQASFKGHYGQTVLSLNFNSNIKIEPITTEIDSRQAKLKQIDTSLSIESLWRGMTDVHHFHPMLQQLGISKNEAYRSVPDDLARQVSTDSLIHTLKKIEKEKDIFMAFVGNDAVIQVYTGPVLKICEIKNHQKLVIHGVTKEGNPSVIKISKKDIGQAWVVNKKSNDDFITSLEIFDHNENHIVQFYGMRKEGQKQNENWSRLMKSLPRVTQRQNFCPPLQPHRGGAPVSNGDNGSLLTG